MFPQLVPVLWLVELRPYGFRLHSKDLEAAKMKVMWEAGIISKPGGLNIVDTVEIFLIFQRV
jgi:hypothetical protein